MWNSHRPTISNMNVGNGSYSQEEVEAAQALMLLRYGTLPPAPSVPPKVDTMVIEDLPARQTNTPPEPKVERTEPARAAAVKKSRTDSYIQSLETGLEETSKVARDLLEEVKVLRKENVEYKQERLKNLSMQLRNTSYSEDTDEGTVVIQRERKLNGRRKRYNQAEKENYYHDEDADERVHMPSNNIRSVPPSVPKNRDMNEMKNHMVAIGDGHAKVPARLLKNMNWNSYTNVTRKLLTAVFTRRVLATHSLTGKRSPAFPGKPAKKKLDPVLVSDIVQTVVERCGVPENVVRTSITTKCADESKMFRIRDSI